MGNSDQKSVWISRFWLWLETQFYNHVVAYVGVLLTLTVVVYRFHSDVRAAVAMVTLTLGIAVLAQSAITSKHLDLLDSGDNQALNKVKKNGTWLRVMILMGTCLVAAAVFRTP